MVLREVGLFLGVRVHNLKLIKSVGGIISIPSVAEREKIVSNKKFVDARLVVEKNTLKWDTVIIHSVPQQFSQEEFLKEILFKYFDHRTERR